MIWLMRKKIYLNPNPYGLFQHKDFKRKKKNKNQKAFVRLQPKRSTFDNWVKINLAKWLTLMSSEIDLDLSTLYRAEL